MRLHEIGPGDRAGIAAYVAAEEAVNRMDAPWREPVTAYRLEMDLRYGWDGEPPRCFLAEEGGRSVGVGWIRASDYDNLDAAWIGPAILPERRRQGAGRRLEHALLAECAAMARPLVSCFGWDEASTVGFARSGDWAQKSVNVCRRLWPGDAAAAIDAAHDDAAPHAIDYQLDRIAGASPTELLAPLAELTATINDAPLDDLEMEDEVFSPERVSAYEHAQIAGGHRLYRLVARHRGTGELAGHTVVAVETERPWLGHQHDTAVAAGHRGHRLGLVLKAAVMHWLRVAEPELKVVETWNAESNRHMVAVNERLGYRPMARELFFQRRL